MLCGLKRIAVSQKLPTAVAFVVVGLYVGFAFVV